MIKKNYYLILEITRDEDQTGVREAFRRMAKKYHPDLAGPEWARKFQDINEAYEVLSDPEKRKKYNDELRSYEEKEPARPRPDFVSRTSSDSDPLISEPIRVPRDFFITANPIDALFDRFFRNFSRLGEPKAERIESLTAELVLSPEEARRGGRITINVPSWETCPFCDGTGGEWPFTCPVCQGQGLVEREKPLDLTIPPRVRSGTILEAPLHGLGVRNIYLRLHIRVGSPS